MSNFKVITLFHANEKIPFMTCMLKDVEEYEQGVKLTLENGNSIYINDYDSFFLSESADDFDKERMVNVYKRLISELSKSAKKQ
ncbi:TPA: hypothetical protein ACHOY6_003894 [Raoultella planticola]